MYPSSKHDACLHCAQVIDHVHKYELHRVRQETYIMDTPGRCTNRARVYAISLLYLVYAISHNYRASNQLLARHSSFSAHQLQVSVLVLHYSKPQHPSA